MSPVEFGGQNRPGGKRLDRMNSLCVWPFFTLIGSAIFLSALKKKLAQNNKNLQYFQAFSTASAKVVDRVRIAEISGCEYHSGIRTAYHEYLSNIRLEILVNFIEGVISHKMK